MNRDRAALVGRLESWIDDLQSVVTGLKGDNWQWSELKRKQVANTLAKFKLSLVTRNGASKQGFSPRDDAPPMAAAYYPAPIGRYCDLFILETDFVKSARAKDPKLDQMDRYDEKAAALGFASWRAMMIAIYEGKATVNKSE